MRILLLCIACLVVLVPIGAAQSDPKTFADTSIVPNATFSQVEVRADEVIDQTRREALSKELDTDQDGFITASEEYAYESTSQTTFTSDGSGSRSVSNLGAKRMLLDQTPPRRVHVYVDLQHVTGPSDDWDDWLVTEVRVYEFQPAARETHRIEGGDASSAPGAAASLVVKAPRGWFVHRIDGTLHDKDQVSLPDFDTARPFTIDYSDAIGKEYVVSSSPTGTPGPDLFLVIAALSAVLFGRVVGRRRS